MRKLVSIIVLLCICLSLCACGSSSNSSSANGQSNITQEPTHYTPNKQDLLEGIKYDFKDPDSVQISDCYWAWQLTPNEDREGKYYILCTIRAKNSFGGYVDPQTYSVYGTAGEYTIEREWNVYNEAGLKDYFDYHFCKGEIYTMP